MVGTIFFDGVALAQVQTLDIIEHSSTSLTGKFNGTDIPAADIVNNGSDDWTITIAGLTGSLEGASRWTEPESPPFRFGSNNSVVASGVIVSVDSDLPGGGIHDNGATDTTSFFVGTAPLDVRFTDNGDAVPDAAATFSLLSLSLAGLGFAKRMFLRTV